MLCSLGCCCAPNLAFPQELNKRLTVHVSSFLHRLRKLMCRLLAGQTDTATSFSCHHIAGSLSLHVKSELSGLPFYWDFHCCPAPVEMVSNAAESLGRGMAKIKDCFLMLAGFWVVSGRAGVSACCPSLGSLSPFLPIEALAPWFAPAARQGWPSTCCHLGGRCSVGDDALPVRWHSGAMLFSFGAHREEGHRVAGTPKGPPAGLSRQKGIKVGAPWLLRGCSYHRAAQQFGSREEPGIAS